jgi:predicted regulator of Ras-like GTPase activity (Roadblock/LC7/MglB family)
MAVVALRTDAPLSFDVARASAKSSLKSLLERSPALRFACLGTADGRTFAHAAIEGVTGPERIAAMTSSILALSESFAKDALRGNCNYSVVSTQHGSIIVVRVPVTRGSFMLSVGSDGSELVALTLRAALDEAERLVAILDADA